MTKKKLVDYTPIILSEENRRALGFFNTKEAAEVNEAYSKAHFPDIFEPGYLEEARRTKDTDPSPKCPKCGNVKEFNGEPDACLGLLPGVVDACCGHGDRNEAYVHFQNGMVLEGFVIGKKMEEDAEPLWILNEASIESEESK